MSPFTRAAECARVVNESAPATVCAARGRGHTFQERWCAVDDTTAPAVPRSSVTPLFQLTVFDHVGNRHDIIVDDREAHEVAEKLAWALNYSLEPDQT